MAVIRARTNKLGKTSYQVQIRLKGYPLQTATFDRKSDAARWGQQTEASIKEGRYFKTTEAKKHTLSDLIDRYIKTTLPTKPKSIEQQTAQLNWWKDEIGYKLLVDVTPSLLAECKDKLLNQPTHQSEQRAPATTVRYMAALSHALTIAVNEWEWLEANPMKKVKRPKEPRGRVRYLDDDERERLLKSCQESKTSILYTVVMVAIATGMRKGEIMGLKWQDVDLNRGRVTLHDTKNGERRVVPLAGKALELMKEHSKIRRLGVAWVFPSHNGKSPAVIIEAWKNAIERAGIENFHFHDLRHTTASYLAMSGASLGEIADILGHKTLQMVKRYAHLSDSHVAGVLQDMNKKIFGE